MSKLSLFLLSLILAGVAGACNYKAIVATQDLSGDAPGASAKQLIDSVYLLGVGDQVPDSSSLLADMTLYSPLIWLEPYDYGHSAFLLMLERARKEAREMGGNAIRILDCSAPKFARVKMVARVYFLKQPPVSLAVSTDSCIVHVKINYAVGRAKPVPVYLNDSLIGISKGCDLAGHWHIDYGPIVRQRVEQFTLESAKGGLLSVREKSIRYPVEVMLEKGREYYIFVRYSSPRVWTRYFVSIVTKEEFELDQYLF